MQRPRSAHAEPPACRKPALPRLGHDAEHTRLNGYLAGYLTCRYHVSAAKGGPDPKPVYTGKPPTKRRNIGKGRPHERPAPVTPRRPGLRASASAH